MKLICNLLLNVIVTIWSFWVFAFGRADFNAPYFKWFVKCWDANDRSGGIVWNEFLATMKYLTLHYIQRHDEAEECYKYTNLVDMTPFTYENRGRYSEDDWDFLVNQIYMAGSSQNTNHKMSSSQQRETDSQERETGSVNEFQSSPEPDINEVPKSKTEEALEPKVEEQPTYEWEEETCFRKWLWILLALLVAGGIGVWYYMSDGGASEGRSQIEAVDSDSIPVVDTSEVYNDVVPSSPLAFLEEFYKGNYEDSEYIKQHVTANVLNKLKRAYDYDCPSNDCLAVWVFSAYPPGSDLYLEEGPIITKSKEGEKYSVYYSYYSQGQSGKIYKPRGLLVSVTEIDGKYLISDYELVMPDVVQKPSDLADGGNGQYYMHDGFMYLHIVKDGPDIEADFNFRDGTYVSATYEFSCRLDEEKKFCASVHKTNGEGAGKIEGLLENDVLKVDVEVHNKYSGTYEFKLE